MVSVRIESDGLSGYGECVPYARYGETPETTLTTIEALAPAITKGLSQAELQDALPPSAARNAIDCAFWDLAAKRAGISVAELANINVPDRFETAFTISLGTPEVMAEAAAKARAMPLLKVKLGAPGDAARLEAVRKAAPDTRLIVDANEGWQITELPALFNVCAACGVELIEQPLPAANDAVLADITCPVPICADESVHALAGLDELIGRYDAINIKLDKTGGLTEGLKVARHAKALGLSVMVGCMVSTSLSMLPACLLASYANWIDLDGPLLLAKDRAGGLVYANGTLLTGQSKLWG